MPGWSCGSAPSSNAATHLADDPRKRAARISGYRRAIARFAAESRTIQQWATLGGAAAFSARAVASATFRSELRAAAPRSPNRFHASSTSVQACAGSASQMSIECDGSAGRVASSKEPCRPFKRPISRRYSWMSRCPASARATSASMARENATDNGRRRAIPSPIQTSSGTPTPTPCSIALTLGCERPTRRPRSAWVNRSRLRDSFTTAPSVDASRRASTTPSRRAATRAARRICPVWPDALTCR